MNNQQQKKKKPITAIVMFALAAIFAVMLICGLISFETTNIGAIVGVAIWTIGFVTLGLLALKTSAKSLGWLAGVAMCLGLLTNLFINGLDYEADYEAVLGSIILTIVFVVIFIIKNIKHKK